MNIGGTKYFDIDVPDTQKEAEDIRLLLFVQLTDILVGTHFAGWGRGRVSFIAKSVSSKRQIVHPSSYNRSLAISIQKQHSQRLRTCPAAFETLTSCVLRSGGGTSSLVYCLASRQSVWLNGNGRGSRERLGAVGTSAIKRSSLSRATHKVGPRKTSSEPLAVLSRWTPSLILDRTPVSTAYLCSCIGGL